MSAKKPLTSAAIITLIVLMTALCSFLLLMTLSLLGLAEFTGGGWLIESMNLVTGYLGHSILFFAVVLIGYVIIFARLRMALSSYKLDEKQVLNVRYYNVALDLFTTLFFAIGVLFTAWGLQNALVSALGDLSEDDAAKLGAWEILRRLVDNGILIALWTTIVGGVGGYIMRLTKLIFLGKALNEFSAWKTDRDKTAFFGTLNAIRDKVEAIADHLNKET